MSPPRIKIRHLRCLGLECWFAFFGECGDAFIAIVDARYELAGQNGSASRKMWSTLIVQRSKQGWQIAAIRNMLPAPPAGTS